MSRFFLTRSHRISATAFLTLVMLYALGSLGLHLGTAFTSLAWLIYIPSLIPLYLLTSLIALGIVAQKTAHPPKQVRYYPGLILPVALGQLLTILSSPASCYGWSQGKTCYSFLQAHLSDANLQTLDDTPAHWTQVEDLFLWALLGYAIAWLVLVASSHLDRSPD